MSSQRSMKRWEKSTLHLSDIDFSKNNRLWSMVGEPWSPALIINSEAKLMQCNAMQKKSLTEHNALQNISSPAFNKNK